MPPSLMPLQQIDSNANSSDIAVLTKPPPIQEQLKTLDLKRAQTLTAFLLPKGIDASLGYYDKKRELP